MASKNHIFESMTAVKIMITSTATSTLPRFIINCCSPSPNIEHFDSLASPFYYSIEFKKQKVCRLSPAQCFLRIHTFGVPCMLYLSCKGGLGLYASSGARITKINETIRPRKFMEKKNQNGSNLSIK